MKTAMNTMDYASLEARTIAHLKKPEPTMSHIQIAEVVHSRPDNVKRTMERLLDRGVIAFTPMEETLQAGALRRVVTTYHVNERDSYVVVAQLCPEYTAKLVDFWMHYRDKLQQQPELPDFTNPVEAARAWADEVEGRQLAEQKLIEDEPYTEYGKTNVVSEGSLNLTKTAKTFGVGPIKFTRFLRSRGYLFLNDYGVNQPMQKYIDQGWFEVAPVSYNRGYGLTVQTFVTGKGQQKLHELVQRDRPYIFSYWYKTGRAEESQPFFHARNGG